MSGLKSSRLESRAPAIWFAVILLTLGGLLAATGLPVSLFPHIDYPRVVIAIDAGDRDAAQMAAEITRPVEIAARTVPGVTRIRSTTSRGSAEVALSFGWNEDMPAAKLAAEGAVTSILPDLPAGTRFEVHRSDPTQFPVLGIALTSPSLDQEALRQIAELKVRPALTGIADVAGVDILGGSAREIEVDVDPARLQTLGLGITDVTDGPGQGQYDPRPGPYRGPPSLVPGAGREPCRLGRRPGSYADQGGSQRFGRCDFGPGGDDSALGRTQLYPHYLQWP